MKKMRLKMENRSCIYDINRPRPRHGHKYINYKMGNSTMMVICIKQRLTVEAQFTKKLSYTEAELKKSVAYIKKACS